MDFWFDNVAKAVVEAPVASYTFVLHISVNGKRTAAIIIIATALVAVWRNTVQHTLFHILFCLTYQYGVSGRNSIAMKRNAGGKIDINARCFQLRKYPKLNVDSIPDESRIDCTTERLLL